MFGQRFDLARDQIVFGMDDLFGKVRREVDPLEKGVAVTSMKAKVSKEGRVSQPDRLSPYTQCFLLDQRETERHIGQGVEERLFATRPKRPIGAR